MILILAVALALAEPSRSEESSSPPPASTSTVGMPAKIDQLILPGTELEVKPSDDRRDPVVLRIVGAYPHGSAFRYNFVYYTLEPGEFDLRAHLRRKDGSALGDLPPIPVKVSALLPAGQIEPHALHVDASPWLGGYRFLVALGASLWLAGLAYIVMRGRRHAAARSVAPSRPLTLGDRLRPLAAAALDGTLGEAQRAELERLLIGYWRKRLGLEHERPAAAMAAMRSDPDAGPLLRCLEDWLHRPESDRRVQGDELASLLRPYLDVADDPTPAVTGEAVGAAGGLAS
jgi:hypothetical protein